MNNLKQNAPILLLILFEIIIGILLLANPEGFTKTIIIAVGIAMLLIGIIYLIRYFRGRNDGSAGPGSLIVAIVSLILGCILTFANGVVYSLFAVIAVFYGIILLVGGIYKVQNYRLAKKAGALVSPILMISGILSIICGVIIVLNPFSTTMVMFQFAGIIILVEAVIDLISVIVARR